MVFGSTQSALGSDGFFTVATRRLVGLPQLIGGNATLFVGTVSTKKSPGPLFGMWLQCCTGT
jgi:hypothetical protein